MNILFYIDQLKRLTQYYQPVIGVTYDGDLIAVVEIIKTINHIKIVNKKLYDAQDSVYQQISDDFKIENKLIALNLDNSLASYKLLSLPDLAESDINIWLRENYSEYLPVSLSVDSIVLSYRLITIGEEQYLFVGFVNQDEINNLLTRWPKETIITGISPGFSDTALATDKEKDQVQGNYVVHETYHEFILHKNHQLLFYNQIPASFQKENSESGYKSSVIRLFKDSLQNLSYEVSDNNFTVEQNKSGYKTETNEQQDLESCFYPAYAQARNALIIPDANMNFITRSCKEKGDIYIWKQALMKLILAGGIVTIILYLFILVPTLLMNLLHEQRLDEKNSLIPQLANLEGLKVVRNNLENDLENANRISAFKSETYILLRAMAHHIPRNCWITEIEYNKTSKDIFNSTVMGMSSDREAINGFLQKLESDKNFSEVKLDYIDQKSSDEMYRLWKIRSSKYLEFKFALRF